MKELQTSDIPVRFKHAEYSPKYRRILCTVLTYRCYFDHAGLLDHETKDDAEARNL